MLSYHHGIFRHRSPLSISNGEQIAQELVHGSVLSNRYAVDRVECIVAATSSNNRRALFQYFTNSGAIRLHSVQWCAKSKRDARPENPSSK